MFYLTYPDGRQDSTPYASTAALAVIAYGAVCTTPPAAAGSATELPR